MDKSHHAQLVDRVRVELPELSARVVEEIVESLPSFRALPRDVVATEVGDAVHETLALVLDALQGDQLRTEQLAGPLRRVMARVDERPAPAEVFSAYFIGARVAWERIRDRADAPELPQLLRLVEPMTRQLQYAVAAATDTYLDEDRHLQGEVGEARRELVAALLAGEPTDALAARAGVGVTGSYVVVGWCVAPPSVPLTGRSILVWRRRIRAAFDEAFGSTVLSELGKRGGTALVPCSPSDPRVTVTELRGFVDDLGRIVGAPVTAAASVAGTAEAVPRAAEEVRDVLQVASRLGRPPGLYELDDLLLEVQLARPGTASDRLVGLLSALESHPDLVRTLRVALETNGNRRRAAAALHVHPNTLVYRLRRIAKLTGQDPTRPDGMRVLFAALTAHDIRESDPDGRAERHELT
ncbi:helix-turn-helix domain-containing protein [Haloechinothrix sp. LS1_15]|uniref:PucR family transcriptional regulator n=1 Tax=Haloechinothrix sp. LS1_15 TaxID=2652248 RepID=UPI00294AAF8D|nr:helix-turn-helix domain-containing protein [Haloechinothrix sp. LS1_15]